MQALTLLSTNRFTHAPIRTGAKGSESFAVLFEQTLLQYHNSPNPITVNQLAAVLRMDV